MPWDEFINHVRLKEEEEVPKVCKTNGVHDYSALD